MQSEAGGNRCTFQEGVEHRHEGADRTPRSAFTDKVSGGTRISGGEERDLGARASLGQEKWCYVGIRGTWGQG